MNRLINLIETLQRGNWNEQEDLQEELNVAQNEIDLLIKDIRSRISQLSINKLSRDVLSSNVDVTGSWSFNEIIAPKSRIILNKEIIFSNTSFNKEPFQRIDDENYLLDLVSNDIKCLSLIVDNISSDKKLNIKYYNSSQPTVEQNYLLNNLSSYILVFTKQSRQTGNIYTNLWTLTLIDKNSR